MDIGTSPVFCVSFSFFHYLITLFCLNVFIILTNLFEPPPNPHHLLPITTDPPHQNVLLCEPEKRDEYGKWPAELWEPASGRAGAGGFKTWAFTPRPRRSAKEQPPR